MTRTENQLPMPGSDGGPRDPQQDQGPTEEDEEQQESKKQEDAEAADVANRQSPSGKIVYKAICREGADELERPSSALFWSGIAAGLSMGFSLVTEGLLRAYLPERHWAPLVAKLGYSMGFMIVILGRQQLFTENTLTVILPLLSHRKMSVFWNVLRLWAVVLVANILGAAAFAAAVAHSSVFNAEVQSAFAEVGHKAFQYGFGTVLVKGIFGGWLIALMVWLLPFAESFRVLVIILITYVVGLGELSHVIAGAVETFYVVMIGQKPWPIWFTGFFFPALIGNIIGGVTLVAVLNYAQVKAGGGEDM